jgi:hypothetical protein
MMKARRGRVDFMGGSVSRGGPIFTESSRRSDGARAQPRTTETKYPL